ncbi:MAG: NAD-binding protein [Candidatus Palauibacterales bacterium]|nr:NAD-binding protein [Candidatus Palauibacterales bacterium]
MKITSSLLAHFLEDKRLRKNVRTLGRYLLLIAAVIAVFSVVFHFIMWGIEGQEHSWITGLYWTLTVMSTLGFGDITFTSDIGRLFTVVVLLSGIVLLLIVLPFAFIRHFYAPWLEEQIKRRAPREVPDGTSGHVILVRQDSVTPGLIERMELHDIPYFLVEPDPETAARMDEEGLSVVVGERDSHETYEALRVRDARLVLANDQDTTNTNIALTVREQSEEVPVAAVATDPDSVDILELSGASHVLPLTQRLGEQLAIRLDVGPPGPHVIGSLGDLAVAEVPVHDSRLAGRTLDDLGLRERWGLNIVGVWEHARLEPARADTRLSERSVPVVVGPSDGIEGLARSLGPTAKEVEPVLIIGGGKVGRAAAGVLQNRGVPVHMVERKEELRDRIGDLADRLYIGDAANRTLLEEAGIGTVPSVLLTTNDDAMNVYLAAYCRRLRDDLHIVSRITHQRNIPSIRRAGADFVLSYATLGIESVWALIRGRPTMILGEGVELHRVSVPDWLEGRTLSESRIASRSGLTVVGIQGEDGTIEPARASTRLRVETELLTIGSEEQLMAFMEAGEEAAVPA